MKELKLKWSVVVCLVLAGSAAARVFDSDTFPIKGGRYDSQNAVTYHGKTIDGETIDIELVSLSLVCREPVNVVSPSSLAEGTYHIDSFFDVFTELSIDGGEYQIDSFFDVFTELSIDIPSDYGKTGTFATEIVSMSLTGNIGGISIMIRESPSKQSQGETTVTDLDSGMYDIDSFFDVFIEISIDGGETWIPADVSMHMQHTSEPRPHFLISSKSQWGEALEGTVEKPAHIRPMDPCEWDKYMVQFTDFHVVIEGGEPYPEANFLPADLSVYSGHIEDSRIYGDPNVAGLVMAWGDADTLDGNYTSAWIYDYGMDPDLSNSTITITVNAPQFFSGSQINVVSFGIQDINGNIRAWYWNVGPAGPIFWNTPITITINAALTGLNATNPPATGYVNNPLFDITQSQFFIVDENATWVGGTTPVPPPGQTVSRMWNYWYNLVVTPNPPAKGDDPIKWSQPPVKYRPEHDLLQFYGWDEFSNYPWSPHTWDPPIQIVADDWMCKTDEPVTDIHWWGSFIGWDQPYPPSVMPTAFHIGIWTNVPAEPGIVSFSHPGKMIWENYCDNYTWNFAGYDRDPRPGIAATPVTTIAVIPQEACFQFNQYLDPNDWFYQEPGTAGTIYWLSIAAIWDKEPEHPWGWKTRPHFFEDDAVRIRAVQDPKGVTAWPPQLGSVWGDGDPIEYPDGKTWDVAFELTTMCPCCRTKFGDLNNDRIVDFKDFAIFAGNWLEIVP